MSSRPRPATARARPSGTLRPLSSSASSRVAHSSSSSSVVKASVGSRAGTGSSPSSPSSRTNQRTLSTPGVKLTVVGRGSGASSSGPASARGATCDGKHCAHSRKLTLRLIDAESDLTESEALCQNLEKQLASVRADSETRGAKFKEALAENARLNDRIAALKGELAAAAAAAASPAAPPPVATTTQGTDPMAQPAAAPCKGCASRDRDIAALEAVREELLAENDALTERHRRNAQSLAEEARDAHERLGKAEIERAAAQARADRAQAELERLRSELLGLREENKKLKGSGPVAHAVSGMKDLGISGRVGGGDGDDDDDDDDSFAAALARELKVMSQAYEDKIRLLKDGFERKEYEYRETLRAMNDTARSERALMRSKIASLEAQINRSRAELSG